MKVSGDLLIGGAALRGGAASFSATNPANGSAMEPSFAGATKNQVEQATAIAWDAFPIYRETPLEKRALFLEAIAENILELGDDLILRAMDETGLPRGRLEGERARTVGQLRLFAKEVREGAFQELRFDPADPDRKPAPKPDLRLRNVALGPVAVFGASNFPLAFSVAGGDTASAPCGRLSGHREGSFGPPRDLGACRQRRPAGDRSKRPAGRNFRLTVRRWF